MVVQGVSAQGQLGVEPPTFIDSCPTTGPHIQFNEHKIMMFFPSMIFPFNYKTNQGNNCFSK